MTTEMAQIPRPLPRPSPFSRPFWEAARRHELMIQRCSSCQSHIFYPRYNCPHCGSRDLEWVKASGRAKVYTYTVARRPTHPAFADRVPYVIAIVELEEGPRLTTNIVDCDPESVRIDMPVEVGFEDVDEEISLPMFRPASS
ncbi:MAG: Zn-ribbon domain-containing OB-fold protein [Dehalococcoidia bacterium]|nr:Zn-ribbon domain-containing OB-fold protein [Dehalococcoidia bacterium]